MSYQVLARKLRPPHFDALVGQEHVVRALAHALDAGRLHHAYLFTGTRGVGKTTIARIFAKCLNCETGITSTPCGECSACREIAEGRFVDLIEVDAASRTKIDDTRDLLDNVQYLPARGRFKVYLIDEVHMLSTASFNALLKTLEEPPEHVKFLLATTDPRKVPVTVLSRCLQFQLKNLLPERIGAYLTDVLHDEGIVFDAESVELIARAARGSMRDALSILDQAVSFGGGRLVAGDVGDMLGSIERQELEPLLDALARADGTALLAHCERFAERAADFREILGALLAALHEIAVVQLVGGRTPSSVAERFAPLFDPETVQLYYQIVLTGLRDFVLAPDPRIAFEMTLLRALAFEPEPSRAAPGPTESSGRRSAAAKAAPAPARSAAVAPIASQPASSRAASSQPTSSRAASSQPASSRAAPMPDGRSAAPDRPANAHHGGPTEGDDWYATVAALPLNGVARMLVEHSVLSHRAASEWRLCLDSDHDTLLNDKVRAAIERALSVHVGGDLRVTIEVGRPMKETPALRNAREERERHARAVAALQADDNVRSILDEFGAELSLDSVRPVKGS